MMSLIKNRLSLMLLCLFTGFGSVSANALIIWAVESGAGMSSNTEATPLVASPGLHSFDLYMDTEGEDIFGWDLTFLASGSSSVTAASGADLGVGAMQPNGGYRQFGAESLAITPLNGLYLAMTLNWQTPSGETLIIADSSSFVDGNFSNQFLNTQVLAESVSAEVPVPGAAWLFVSGVAFLVTERVRKVRRD